MEPGTDNAFALVLPYVNTQAMQEFLDRFAATIAQDEHVALVLDQAGWHGSGALIVPDNITLVPLPPYSPELNPVERLWLYLRQHHWSNRVYPNLTAVEDAAVSGWRAVCLGPDWVKTICRCDYLPDGR